VRRFAYVIGVHAKTDSVDAKLLARFAAMVEIAPTTQKGASFQALCELMNARQSLLADRTAIKNRSLVQTAKLLIRQNEARLKLIESQIKAIDHEAMKLIDSDTALSARFKILVSIPGISSLTACVMLNEMPELGTLDQRQVASRAGLSPHARESGKWKGKRFICGGRGICARPSTCLPLSHHASMPISRQNATRSSQPKNH
jgi:transposase